MSELKFTGNCLKGSRPLLSFDGGFEESPHNQILRELLSQVVCLQGTTNVKVFGTPKMHPKSKPFIDHVLTFSLVDGRIWVRNYQIIEEEGNRSALEIGPRFVMNPIKILSGGFSGTCLWENPFWVSPNVVRASQRRKKDNSFAQKVQDSEERHERRLERQLGPDVLDDVFDNESSEGNEEIGSFEDSEDSE
jgi:ribosome biogenesis protein BRX1